MAILNVLLTHLDAPAVERQLAYLRSLSPDSRFVACHGGRRADFDAIGDPGVIFIEDPTLRGPHFQKSLNDTLVALYEAFVRDDPTVELVHAIEYDQLVLRPDFERSLEALADRHDAGLFAKGASPRNDTNWPHYLAARDDERLNRFVARISVRDDPSARLGCLGTGLLLRRDALAAFCAMEDPPAAYVELFVPTAIHHLGFDVVDVDAISDLYAAVRWLPEFRLEEAMAQARAGRTFVHPFKQLAQSEAVRAAAAA